MGNIDPKKMKKMMKQMGMETEEIDSEEVVIIKKDEEIHIKEPEVNKINMMGTETYQITGKEEIKDKEIDIPDGDVNIVSEKADCSKEEAEKALKDNNGEIAKAIKDIKN
ncbi:MAG: nascent polypeptide-associated complex protein [Candidatus Woesearchaeota archaeon]